MEYKTQKEIIFTLENVNTMNLLVNPLTHAQLMELLYQTLQLEKNDSVAVEREYRGEDVTEVI